VVRDSNKFGLK